MASLGRLAIHIRSGPRRLSDFSIICEFVRCTDPARMLVLACDALPLTLVYSTGQEVFNARFLLECFMCLPSALSTASSRSAILALTVEMYPFADLLHPGLLPKT